jgi:SSS family solute:Na+ symporter
MNISTPDLLIIIFYLTGILAIGVLSIRGKKMNSDRYFLADRSLNWAVIGAALFASNISTIHLVGLSAQGFRDGLVWGNFEWMAAFLLIVLGLVFAPFYFKNKISTLPEYLEKRYSPAARTLLAIIAILTALFAHIGISLYAGAVLFRNFFGIGIWWSIILISAITAIYTVLGGLKAVVLTETIQTVILIAGAGILTGIAIFSLSDLGIHNLNDLKIAAKPDQLSMLQGGKDAIIPWYAVILGYPVLGIYYWCADQTIVQRVLGARSLKDAQVGPVFAGFIKILPVFLMVFPGVLAYVLFQDKITDSNDTLLVLITELLPVGLKGLMAAALMAALMSTIAAALNSAGTLVSIDIMKRYNPHAADRKLVVAGRITSVCVMILAILWSPLIGKFESIFEAIAIIMAMISPPVSSVFVFGALWKRGTRQAASATLIVGIILGIITFCFDFAPISGYAYLSDGLGMHFMMQAWWLFTICSLIFVGVSLITPRPEIAQLEDLTLSFQLKKMHIPLAGWLSLLLIACMLCLYLVFA